jgi:hypothetical protein
MLNNSQLAHKNDVGGNLADAVLRALVHVQCTSVLGLTAKTFYSFKYWDASIRSCLLVVAEVVVVVVFW